METDQLRIQTLQSEDHARWDAFVQQCSDATFFHRAGRQTVIERAFRHQTHFLYAEQYGKVLGVLPLAHIRSRLFGNALTSSPFCAYGGVTSGDDTTTQALVQAAQGLSRELSVDYPNLPS
jgi:CelD/BcsL family acetyltransferase involved in cellulose biosynthesis